MRLFNFFVFWLTLVAIVICLINITGYDDKNLLLFLTNPILMYLEGYSSFMKRFVSQPALMWLFYLLHVSFWFVIGLILDSVVHSSLRKERIKYLIRIGIVSFVIILISILFYMYQNSESKIVNILKYPHQYNEQSVQFAVHRAADQPYGKEYIHEMDIILLTTTSAEIRSTTRHALGKIGTPLSIKVLLKHYNNLDLIGHSLKMNEHTIIEMLDLKQPPEIILAGIRAAELLGFNSFIQPLNLLISNYPNESIQVKANKVLRQINNNPQTNDPKYSVD